MGLQENAAQSQNVSPTNRAAWIFFIGLRLELLPGAVAWSAVVVAFGVDGLTCRRQAGCAQKAMLGAEGEAGPKGHVRLVSSVVRSCLRFLQNVVGCETVAGA